MRGQSFLDRLKQRFGEEITGANLEALDPWIEVSPSALVEVSTYLRDEPDLRFDMLQLISGVDYFEPDPKKATKTTWQPHTELVYHLWSVPNRVSLVLKVMLPRWKNDVAGELPEAPTVRDAWRPLSATACRRTPTLSSRRSPIERGRIARSASPVIALLL